MKAIVILLLGVFFLTSCHSSENTAQTPANNEENSIKSLSSRDFPPFMVYQDNTSIDRYHPAGYMPDGNCIVMDLEYEHQCQQGEKCIRVNYDVNCSRKHHKWAGVYWLHPADNWGQKKGGYDLTGATKLVFWARGHEGGERIEEFKIGGVGMAKDFPDTDSASIGPVILQREWKKYTIDLRGKDLGRIAGGFAWVTNVNANPDSCVFYLDNIYFE